MLTNSFKAKRYKARLTKALDINSIVPVNGLVKLYAFNVHIFPSKYLVYF